MTIEFQAWPKTPRLVRDITVSEKIDGTNGAIHIQALSHREALTDEPGQPLYPHVFVTDGVAYRVGAQSRKRLVTPEDDNFGFAQWVWDNATALSLVLGEGVHYGEWWGSGIQRGYGLPKGEKRFSLFNAHRYKHVPFHDVQVQGLGVVPVLHQGTFSVTAINAALAQLDEHGSQAAPGFKPAEGVIVYHSASKQSYKVLLVDDDKPKGEAA